MDAIEILPLVSRWLHIIAACVLVGGVVFLRFAVVAVGQSTDADDSFFESIRSRWARLVMFSVLFLLVSGLYNAAVKATGYTLDGVYLTLLAAKIGLALVVFFLVSVLSGRSKMAVRFRSAGTRWYDLTCLAMLLLVCIAGYLKLSPQTVKAQDVRVGAVSATATPYEILDRE